jgi:hypothetical protein
MFITHDIQGPEKHVKHTSYARWLIGPPLAGGIALLAGAGAVAIPTLIRAAVNGVVTGCEYSPYVPFVLLAAILLRWWQAALVALACVGTDAMFHHGSWQAFVDSSCFETSAMLFLAGSAAMVGAAVLVRRVAARMLHREADRGIVFSLENGNIWASWYDSGPRVRLGSNDKVAAMMEDFLAQHRVAERLSQSARTADRLGDDSTQAVA